MMHLFINSLAASAGGGLTYIRNVLPRLSAQADLRVTVAASPGLKEEFSRLANVEFLELEVSPARRFWYERSALARVIRRSGANVLLSTGNVALRKSPVPQILLSRNSIYTSADYYRDLLARHEYRMWLDTQLRAAIAKKSVGWADVTVAPSEAFADELRRWTGRPVFAIYHGFDDAAFTSGSASLSPKVAEKLQDADGALKLLFVSHYNYYRNFETLIRALPQLRQRLQGRPVRLLLTCELAPGSNPGAYRPETAAKLVKELGLSEVVVELGAIPYGQLHHLYGRADIYVTPAYTETFAHPLVEAMACGLPVVASDLPVHREICSESAEYFPRFSEEALAQTVANVAMSTEKLQRMSAAGRERARQFSWKIHVDKILELSTKLLQSKQSGTAK
jgi:glycosyltransferase involved in cell wall biosynthesis